MSNNIAKIMAVILMIGGMTATMALAESEEPQGPTEPRGKGAQRRERRRERFNKAVKPTEEQQKQLEQIFKTHRQEAKCFHMSKLKCSLF